MVAASGPDQQMIWAEASGVNSDFSAGKSLGCSPSQAGGYEDDQHALVQFGAQLRPASWR
jgi:hypothetical protein